MRSIDPDEIREIADDMEKVVDKYAEVSWLIANNGRRESRRTDTHKYDIDSSVRDILGALDMVYGALVDAVAELRDLAPGGGEE
jgi:hypothetical protein